MTLGVTGVVWLPRTAMVNSTALLAGAGPTPLAVASGAWNSVAAAYTDASVTVTRVMAVLAAGWEGAAADAAQARLGAFLGWTQASALKAADVALHAAGGAAAYTTAAVVMPNPAAVAAVESAKIAAYGTGGALNGSAAALEATARTLDLQAAGVMEAYEAATTPLAFHVSFDHPPEIVVDGAGAQSSSSRSVDGASSYEETGVFGFGARTSPAQAAIAAVTAAVQNPAFAGAVGQIASTAGSVAGSSVTTVASAATQLGSAAVSSLTSSPGASHHSMGSGAPIRADSPAGAPAATRAVSAGSMGSVGSGGFGGAGSRLPGGALGGALSSSSLAGGDRTTFGPNGSGLFGPGQDSAGAAARGAHGPAPMSGARPGDDEDEHDTPGYLKQFEHFADGRTVAPSVIGADQSASPPGSRNDR